MVKVYITTGPRSDPMFPDVARNILWALKHKPRDVKALKALVEQPTLFDDDLM